MRGAMNNVWKQAAGTVGRRIAAAACAAMLAALPAGFCAAAFLAAAASDAHACCGSGGGHSRMPFSDACEQLCASAASVLPPDAPPPTIPAVALPTSLPAPAAAIRRGGAPRPANAVPAVSPPRFILHCAFLI